MGKYFNVEIKDEFIVNGEMDFTIGSCAFEMVDFSVEKLCNGLMNKESYFKDVQSFLNGEVTEESCCKAFEDYLNSFQEKILKNKAAFKKNLKKILKQNIEDVDFEELELEEEFTRVAEGDGNKNCIITGFWDECGSEVWIEIDYDLTINLPDCGVSINIDGEIEE